jgi:hypothetical protein
MKKSVVSIDPSGDVCARSNKAALSYEEAADPEHDFELELIAALEENEAEAVRADSAS